MSNSFFERANPPPRRKTCVACTKAKRRCDHSQPACLRCSRRNIDCVYPGSSPARPKAAPVRRVSQALETQSPCSVTETPAPAAAEETHDSLVPWSRAPDILPLDMGDLGHVDLDVGFDDLLVSDTLLDSLSIPVTITPRPDEMMLPVANRPPETSVEEAVATRIQFALDVIKTAPYTMVSENQTPWSHPQLYRAHMPRDMQDAQACCALYTAKNVHNAPVILRTIQARAHELLASPPPKSRLDALARLQATLLYQTIRLFDGDISLRTSAQQTLSALESAVLTLLPFIRWDRAQPDTGPAEDHSSCPTKEIWQEWIFQESARRTVFFTCFFLVAYQVLVGQVQDGGCAEKYLFCQSWTFSAHLWQAVDVVEFAMAWTEKKHYVVDKDSFSDVLRDAGADDVDIFGRMLMVGALGIDDARLWFFKRGGSL